MDAWREHCRFHGSGWRLPRIVCMWPVTVFEHIVRASSGRTVKRENADEGCRSSDLEIEEEHRMRDHSRWPSPPLDAFGKTAQNFRRQKESGFWCVQGMFFGPLRAYPQAGRGENINENSVWHSDLYDVRGYRFSSDKLRAVAFRHVGSG